MEGMIGWWFSKYWWLAEWWCPEQWEGDKSGVPKWWSGANNQHQPDTCWYWYSRWSLTSDWHRPITSPSLELWGMGLWSEATFPYFWSFWSAQRSNPRKVRKDKSYVRTVVNWTFFHLFGYYTWGINTDGWGFCRLSLYPLWWSIYSQGMSKGFLVSATLFHGNVDIIRILLDINRYHIYLVDRNPHRFIDGTNSKGSANQNRLLPEMGWWITIDISLVHITCTHHDIMYWHRNMYMYVYNCIYIYTHTHTYTLYIYIYIYI